MDKHREPGQWSQRKDGGMRWSPRRPGKQAQNLSEEKLNPLRTMGKHRERGNVMPEELTWVSLVKVPNLVRAETSPRPETPFLT